MREPVPEQLTTPETKEQLTEADLRVGILMAVGAQGAADSAEEVFDVLPDELEPVVDRVIRRANIYTDYYDDDSRLFEDYLVEDETVHEWVMRDAEDRYVLTGAGSLKLTSIITHPDTVNRDMFDAVCLKICQRFPEEAV